METEVIYLFHFNFLQKLSPVFSLEIEFYICTVYLPKLLKFLIDLKMYL